MTSKTVSRARIPSKIPDSGWALLPRSADSLRAALYTPARVVQARLKHFPSFCGDFPFVNYSAKHLQTAWVIRRNRGLAKEFEVTELDCTGTKIKDRGQLEAGLSFCVFCVFSFHEPLTKRREKNGIRLQFNLGIAGREDFRDKKCDKSTKGNKTKDTGRAHSSASHLFALWYHLRV